MLKMHLVDGINSLLADNYQSYLNQIVYETLILLFYSP